MKTKEEVVNGIVARFKHEIENVWANGYLSGYNDGRDSTKLFTGTEIPEYQRGLDDAFNTMTAVANMCDEYREKVFGTSSFNQILGKRQHAVARLKDYREHFENSEEEEPTPSLSERLQRYANSYLKNVTDYDFANAIQEAAKILNQNGDE